jgi:hypothetical protein
LAYFGARDGHPCTTQGVCVEEFKP